MGTDITCCVEYRSTSGDDAGKWHQIRINNPYYEKYSKDDEYCSLITPFYARDYILFGILAGVRSNDYPQIDYERGLPFDVSDDVRKYHDTCKEYSYSESWYTLEELDRWASEKKNFMSIDYRDITSHSERSMVKEKDKMVRNRFAHLVSNVRFIASLVDVNTYIHPRDVRIVFWFDC